MATEATIRRWDHVLDEVEKTRKGSPFINLLVPRIQAVRSGFPPDRRRDNEGVPRRLADRSSGRGVGAVCRSRIGREGSRRLGFRATAEPQVDKFMGVVAEARRRLVEDDLSEATAEEVVADLENLLKVSVLVARIGHKGALEIADTERRGRYQSVNKATDRPATYLDLDTMFWVDRPSKTTLALSVFLTMVEPRMATFGQALGQPVEEDQPEIMKRFAAQWVLHVYTEWEEYYRGALAKALGCEKEDIRSDYFADLGRMRQDYVHKARGICKNSARNKVLKWYSKGDNMIPTRANYCQLLADFPAEELLAAKPSLTTAQRQPIPSRPTRS